MVATTLVLGSTVMASPSYAYGESCPLHFSAATDYSGCVGYNTDHRGDFALSSQFVGSSLYSANFENARLDGANFTSARVYGTNFSNASMSSANFGSAVAYLANFANAYAIQANFSSAIVQGANFNGAYLIRANFGGSDLSYSNMTNANLSDVNLAGAVLRGVSSGGITGVPTGLPSGWALTAGYLVGPEANLSGIDFGSADFGGLNLAGANIDNADLSDTNLIGVKSGSISGTPASLPSGWRLVGGFLLGNGANLAGAGLANSNLTDVNLQNSNLAGADLSGTTLTGVRSGGIRGIPLALPSGWSLVDGYLVGPGANLSYANLSFKDLQGLNLSGANLKFANVAGANLHSVNLTGADFNFANLETTNFSAATLSGSSMGHALVTGANFTDADLSSVTGSFIDWKDAICADGTTGISHALNSCFEPLRSEIGPGINLASVDLGTATIDGVNLSGANLTSANLSHVTLHNVKAVSIVGTPASLPKNWNLRHGYLIGPSADLSSINFGNTDISNTNLQGANIAGSSFLNANLTGVKSGGLRGVPSALPEGWSVVDGYLVGPGANLDHADLAGSDLSSVNLTGASLRYASLQATDLTSANLTNAVLTAADLQDATLSRANLTGTNLSRSNIDTADFLFATLNNVSDQNVDWHNSRCADGGLGSTHLANTCLGPALTQAVAVAAPIITGVAKVNAKKVNSISTTGGEWSGIPLPTKSYQWYVCKNEVPATTAIIPTHCTKIAKATTTSLKVLPTYKGKFLSVAVTGQSTGTASSVVLAKSTAKVG